MAENSNIEWTKHFAKSNDEHWCSETGKPSVSLFGNALQVWSSFQGENATVEKAANAFNCPEEMVRIAVQEHYWLFLDGNLIEHEGE